eukprot:GHUV01046193.1.p3 GENE.GHUV01046193.1~~GHUV01046193.1.p3  ORF type:complete len:135 (+),score=31.50 GHUV01046193.1:276-680(+)
MNITKAAQYLTANSGGTWVTAPFSYSDTAGNGFWTPFWAPENLTLARLSNPTSGSWPTKVADKSLYLGFINNPTNLPGEPTSWALNVASIFLSPYGVGSKCSTVSANGTAGDILSKTKRKLPGYQVNVACQNDK